MSSSEFEDYEYGSEDDEWSENEEEIDEEQVEIENTFYEADDIKKSKPAEALSKFLRVLDLESHKPYEEQQWRFQALKNTVLLECNLSQYEEMCTHLSQLVEMMDSVARNDATDAINAVIDASGKIQDPEYSMKVLAMTIEKLKESKNQRLLFNTQAKLAKLYLERKDLEKAESTIQELIKSCQHPDGQDDSSKAQSLIEAYALEIQVCTLKKNNKRLKEVFKRCEALNADVSDPRIIGVIKESGSKMYMSEKLWENALSEQFEAFKCYQEVGNPRAKTMLKYVVLTGILCSSDINPFDSQEAKVYKDDPEIMALRRLRDAYEANNMIEVQGILNDPSVHILDDPYIAQYMEDLLRTVRLSVLQAKLKPYKAVKLSYLANNLQITEQSLINLLVELIIEGKIAARIDEVEGIVETTGGDRTTGRKEEAYNKWVRSLGSLHFQIIERIRT